jgi:hypothetical protein
MCLPAVHDDMKNCAADVAEMERKIIDAVIYKRQKINLIKYVRI